MIWTRLQRVLCNVDQHSAGDISRLQNCFGNVHPCNNIRLIYFIIIFWIRYTKVYKMYLYYSLVRVVFVNLGVYEILLVYYTGFLLPTITRLYFM